jgi:hypothetical protein
MTDELLSALPRYRFDSADGFPGEQQLAPTTYRGLRLLEDFSTNYGPANQPHMMLRIYL